MSEAIRAASPPLAATEPMLAGESCQHCCEYEDGQGGPDCQCGCHLAPPAATASAPYPDLSRHCGDHSLYISTCVACRLLAEAPAFRATATRPECGYSAESEVAALRAKLEEAQEALRALGLGAADDLAHAIVAKRLPPPAATAPSASPGPCEAPTPEQSAQITAEGRANREAVRAAVQRMKWPPVSPPAALCPHCGVTLWAHPPRGDCTQAQIAKLTAEAAALRAEAAKERAEAFRQAAGVDRLREELATLREKIAIVASAYEEAPGRPDWYRGNAVAEDLRALAATKEPCP